MKIDGQFIFSIVVGAMMITWAIGMALSYNIETSPQGMKIESIYEEPLTGPQKVTILKTGKVLIEHLYMPGTESALKAPMYVEFTNMFSDNVVLETVQITFENETIDQMIVPTGDVIPLDNVTGANLMQVFCDNTLVQPKECLLGSI